MLRRLIAVLGLVLFCFVVAAPTFGSVTPYIPPGGSQPGLPGVDDPTYSFSFWGSGIAGGGFLNASGSPLAAGAGSLGTVTDPDETNQVITLVPGSGNWYPGTGGWQFTYATRFSPTPRHSLQTLTPGGYSSIHPPGTTSTFGRTVVPITT